MGNNKTNNKRNFHNKKASKKDVSRGKQRDYREESYDRENPTKDGSYNDPKWYIPNEQILKDVASYPFGRPLGLPISIEVGQLNDSGTTPEYSNFDNHIGGVMALLWRPTVGISDGTSSAVNIAARQLYTWVRHQNSGSANYDSPDLMLYILAMSEAYGYLAHLRRIYGAMNIYSVHNKFYPRLVVEALGADYDDIQANLALLRSYINIYTRKLASMAIPRQISYIERHVWMNTQLFLDAATAKAQTYAYVQSAFMKYDEYSGAGRLVTAFETVQEGSENYAMRRLTYRDLVTCGNSLIEPILASEDLNIMSGDIAKAFKDDLYYFASMPEDYALIPSANMEVLSQITNTTLLGKAVVNINQDAATGAIKCSVLSNFTNPATMKGVVLNMPMDNPEPADVIVATRNIAMTKPGNTYEVVMNGDIVQAIPGTIHTCGSEVFEFALMYYDTSDPTRHAALLSCMPVELLDTSTTRYSRIGSLMCAHTFDWAPTQYVMQFLDPTLPEPWQLMPYGNCLSAELRTFAYMSAENIKVMHDCALLGLLTSPQVAAWTAPGS